MPPRSTMPPPSTMPQRRNDAAPDYWKNVNPAPIHDDEMLPRHPRNPSLNDPLPSYSPVLRGRLDAQQRGELYAENPSTFKHGQKVKIVNSPQFEGQTGQITVIIPNVTTGKTKYVVIFNNLDEVEFDADELELDADNPIHTGLQFGGWQRKGLDLLPKNAKGMYHRLVYEGKALLANNAIMKKGPQWMTQDVIKSYRKHYKRFHKDLQEARSKFPNEIPDQIWLSHVEGLPEITAQQEAKVKEKGRKAWY